MQPFISRALRNAWRLTVVANLGRGVLAMPSSVVCDQIALSAGVYSLTSTTGEYSNILSDYWSTSCGDLKPACILAPATVDQLSAIVTALNSNNVSFAIKSGGHNPNNNFASIQDGVLVSTINLKAISLDQAANTVSVGSGNRWEDVHDFLDGSNTTVVGGRIGEVGVGGYMLGGGLSFLSTQYGWAANNIVAADMVMPNGTIVHVSNTSHADLFAVLRGGGNNFGVVANYVLQGHPIGQIWGGNMIFGGDKTDQILSAVRSFTENYNDTKAAIIPTAELTLFNQASIWVVFFFYDGPSPPAGVFDQFEAIGPTLNTCKTRSYADLLRANNFFVLHNFVYTIGTETTPLPPSGPRGDAVMRTYYDHWFNTSFARGGVVGLVSSMALQPVPRALAREAQARGGDLLALDDSVDRIIFEFDYSYISQIDEKVVDQTMVQLYSGMQALVDGFVADGTLPDAFRPLFMNDAYFRQDYWGRLSTEKRQLAQEVQKMVDPEAVFKARTAGFKI